MDHGGFKLLRMDLCREKENHYGNISAFLCSCCVTNDKNNYKMIRCFQRASQNETQYYCSGRPLSPWRNEMIRKSSK
jgi:hypothetical protein